MTIIAAMSISVTSMLDLLGCVSPHTCQFFSSINSGNRSDLLKVARQAGSAKDSNLPQRSVAVLFSALHQIDLFPDY